MFPTWRSPLGEGANLTLVSVLSAACEASANGRSVTRNHPVVQCPDSLDCHLDPIATDDRTDARRGTGEDDIARQQCEGRGHICDERRDVEDQFRRPNVLLDLAIYDRTERQVRRVEFCLQPRAERAEGIEALGPRPLIVSTLKITRGDVIPDGVRENDVEGPLGRDIAA